ncbi:MAG: hypothetical protein V7K64_20470 [Nostoc sp.]|uniref:hypothetical protein n=1 Tax=unclassified Nostoc TaxID=2593658 RepID=UPI001D1D8A9C|nr:hypothetical protein [Nostoc sp. JL34]MBN3887038.1 hypothetical protein [Nostoc sp. JL34]
MQVGKSEELREWTRKVIEIFSYVSQSIPGDWFVIVTTERGLYADGLDNKI